MKLKMFMWLALVSLLLAIITYFSDLTSLTGPFVIAFFVLYIDLFSNILLVFVFSVYSQADVEQFCKGAAKAIQRMQFYAQKQELQSEDPRHNHFVRAFVRLCGVRC